MTHVPPEMTPSVISTLQNEITQCRNDITAYNTQFLSASVLCAMLAAAATAISTASSESGFWNLFYLLPTVFFFSLYNIIKYTGKQLSLGAYQRYLEHQLNQYFGTKILLWEDCAVHGFEFVFFGAVVQVFFYIPISVFMFYGFCKLPHNWLWYLIGLFTLFQILVIAFMALHLPTIRKNTLKRFGYRISEDGSMEKIPEQTDEIPTDDAVVPPSPVP